MTELQRIQDLLRRTLSGPAWHGDSLSEILNGVTAAQASRKPQGASHSIWELVLHISTWEDVVIRRLQGEPAPIEMNSEQDWPPVGSTTPEQWTTTLDRLRQTRTRLIDVIGALPADKLNAIVSGGDAHHEITYYVLIHGAIHHAVYHSAQIAVVKRMGKESGA